MKKIIDIKEDVLDFENAKLLDSLNIKFKVKRKEFYNSQGVLNGDCLDYIKSLCDNDENLEKYRPIPTYNLSLIQKWLFDEYFYIVESNYVGGLTKQTAWFDFSLTSIDIIKEEGRLELKYKTNSESLNAGIRAALDLLIKNKKLCLEN